MFVSVNPRFSFAQSSSLSSTPRILVRLVNNKTQSLSTDSLENLESYIRKSDYKRLAKVSEYYSQDTFLVKRNGDTISVIQGDTTIKFHAVFKKGKIITVFNNKIYDLNKSSHVKRAIKDIQKRYNKTVSIDLHAPTGLHLFNFAHAKGNGWFIVGGMAILAIGIAIGLSRLGEAVSDTNHTVDVSGQVNTRSVVDIDGDLAADVGGEAVDVLVEDIESGRIAESIDNLRSSLKASSRELKPPAESKGSIQ